MSITSEITRINNNIASAYDECETKGATMPQYENSANLATTIASIPSGGGADLSEYFNTNITTAPTSNYTLGRTCIKEFPTLTLDENVTSLKFAFQSFNAINFTIPEIDLSNITDLSYFYNNNIATETLDISKLKNTENITNLDSFFNGCNNIKYLDCSCLKPNTLSSAKLMFYNCSKLAVLDISNLPMTTLQYSTSYNGMFANCGNSCLQSDGAYADGITKVYVKDTACQTKVIAIRSDWSTNNVIIKTN